MSSRCEANTKAGKRCRCRIADQYLESHGYVRNHLGWLLATLCENHMKVLDRDTPVELCTGGFLHLSPKGPEVSKRNPAVMYFRHRGQVERPTTRGKPSYRWCEGYSEDEGDGKGTFPWLTRAECRAEARKQGRTARFI